MSFFSNNKTDRDKERLTLVTHFVKR